MQIKLAIAARRASGAAFRLVVLLALLAAAWCVLRWAPLVSAQQLAPDSPSADRSEQRLVELVSKVSFNEGGDSYDDLALIWQTVEGHGDTARERAHWLEQHSRCVSGVLSQDVAYTRPGRCRWTRNLHPDGRRPRGWDRERDGHWSRTRPLWLAHLERVRALVRGFDDYRPCAIPPSTWDGDHPGWNAQALTRGFVRVVCIGSARNAGYVRGAL